MADKYGAKEYVDAISDEVDEAVKAALTASRTTLEVIQNIQADYMKYEKGEERSFLISEGVLRLSPLLTTLELSLNNIERLINIMNITACLKGLDSTEAKVIDRGGYFLFNYYMQFVDDGYSLLDYYDSLFTLKEDEQMDAGNLFVSLDNVKNMAQKIMNGYGNIVTRRKGREK